PLPDDSFDFVWNFNTLAKYSNYEENLDELIRVTSRHVMILCVDGWNMGSPIHLSLHKLLNVDWTHGDKLFLFPHGVRRLMERHGLEIVESNVMNCPVWPDTVGFRDMKFHKIEHTYNVNDLDWDANTIRYMKDGYPPWIKAMYMFESIPKPKFVKHIFAHL